MREIEADMALPGTAELAAAERLSREVAMLSGRLAHLLAASPAAHDDQIARAHTFLHAMYDEAATGRTDAIMETAARKPRSDQHPIDRLAAALSLDSGEVDLILLAAMAEQHE